MSKTKKPATITVEIKSRWTGAVLFAAAIAADTPPELHMKAAVEMAVKARANLSDADLSRANLSDANLSDAYLSGANLSDANLSDAYLSRANLSDAYLSGANLSDANLSGANLSGANLSRANLSGAKNFEKARGLAYQIPQEGELIVWKAVTGGVCKLLIPADAKRTATPIGRKCRAEFVKVLEAPQDGRGIHDPRLVYRAGEIIRPDKYDPDPRVECTHGIHFFLTREEAEAYR